MAHRAALSLDFVVDGVALCSRFNADFIDVIHRQGFEEVGPYTFDGAQYHAFFARVRSLITSGG